jgi:hypothetical protein
LDLSIVTHREKIGPDAAYGRGVGRLSEPTDV